MYGIYYLLFGLLFLSFFAYIGALEEAVGLVLVKSRKIKLFRNTQNKRLILKRLKVVKTRLTNVQIM